MNIIKKIFFFWKSKFYFKIFCKNNSSGAATYNLNNIKFLLKKKFFYIFFIQDCYRQFDSYIKKKKKLSIHKQIQVICNPISINFLNLYKESLYYLNKIFFQKDNWKSPLLGAKGVGYECLYKNNEISQITLFNYFGNKKLYKPILEITYGLERIKKNKIKNFIYEKFSSINNIFLKKSFKKILFLFYLCCFNLKKKNILISYYIYIKITNIFNLLDEFYFNNNYNRIKLINILKKFSEKIINFIC
ncbi:glycyl-tRNA synthetase alpha subunit [Candidatus Carsonella ruddii HT isolate Thao2000]|uniref:Glycine--tRNA ligase alpha subunit n=1 Tax=Candidatus Carsonella ruddii HT isolate Thao2000 TaxID=1202539 RepID=J3Z1T4_CARRU|nr:glycine--tRNA ligase subunit alpha [Candidatus Carsonella ruddii]AFP84224.1 glycyl-tRNA synthetase alpha subunit [Candidatus Carsonella ruddii HT isolate Thao2000]